MRALHGSRTLAVAVAVAFSCAVIAEYPPYTKKHLYAERDLRGHRAPKIAAAQWLQGGTPSTAGKTVLVDLWATWCPSCIALIPEMNKWSEEFKGKLVVIGISDESANVVKGFLASKKMTYHVGVDPSQRMEKAVGVQGIPHVLVISPDGIVRWQGYPKEEGDELTDAKLKAIINGG